MQAEDVELLGPDGLLSQVTKAVLERALAEEMTDHLGYEKHDPAGRGSGNSRNGMTSKTLLTDVGAVDLAVPRNSNGSFDPKIVRKGQTRLEGFCDRHAPLRPGAPDLRSQRFAATTLGWPDFVSVVLLGRNGPHGRSRFPGLFLQVHSLTDPAESIQWRT